MNPTYQHTPDMGEISGFGGRYEECCQVMLDAGVKWRERFPEADPKFRGFQNVYGLCMPENGWARSLERCLVQAPIARFGDEYGPSGAQFQAVIERLMYVFGNGWPSYCSKMRRVHEKRQAS
ncbi:MAG: hypothetical protein F4Z40_03655 [Chloroflexi bacterium]|nr:hypothetical protein [Chloroflexota bacterium]